ncbi:MAG: hypothetical protein L3J19_02185 [Sulfurimonas sp.]|nr:hypothetical protein [Sulfurimonas sp.]
MDADLIVKAIMGLVAILAILIFLLFLESDEKPKSKKTISSSKKSTDKKPVSKSEKIVKEQDNAQKTDLESLVRIIKNKKADADKIGEALDLIIKHHGTVHKKLGLRAHPDFDVYMDILFTICRHPNANKELIIKFDRELEELNEEYKKEINEAITKGLNSRRV